MTTEMRYTERDLDNAGSMMYGAGIGVALRGDGWPWLTAIEAAIAMALILGSLFALGRYAHHRLSSRAVPHSPHSDTLRKP